MNETIMNLSNKLVELIEDTQEMCNCSFEEACPCTAYAPVTIDGITYQAKLELTMKKI